MLYFRFPFSDSIFTVNENSDKKSVSFLSFDETESIDFYGNIEEFFFNENILSNQISTELLEFKEENQFEYEAKLGKVIEFIKENQLSKLVVSRRKVFDFDEKKINLSQTFLNLCKSYPNAFVYFFIKDGKCWIGAFSELLGKFDKKTSEFETMSLAGTLPVNETWTAKEIEEQKPVTDFMKNILKNYSSEVEQSETYDHISGNIKHLRTDFKAKIMSEDLENLISELHPTPAVCGIPKDLCKSAIEKFESHPRNFYAGYIKVETEENVQYFVNLRCAEFFENACLIYVGGGITAESSPEKEWRETELKSEAILKNLEFE
ncbi:chorismate-binding protein [Candidatus Kaistella beijingensis]|uniref:chorismate-binding protein n=1 Tax=Candidatus Kaistella beijingensis TaxID=2820270 RepID=UPI001CC59127|nr:chorismate-binding protein [Candidatus Kaistella beijingensis]UBB89603.1 chorismate-binding protein [Candidatus Kaistella beijingensis]